LQANFFTWLANFDLNFPVQSIDDEERMEKMRPLLECAYDLKEIPRTQRLLHRRSLERMFTFAVQEDKVLRNSAIRKAFLDYCYGMATIARHVGVRYSTVSKVIKGDR
jgi:hypothetical protein